MSEDVPAPATAPPKASKKTAAKPRKVGPSVRDLVIKVLSASKERGGVSLPALKKALTAEGYDVAKNNSHVKTALKNLLLKGLLVHTKGTGASGSFKINKEAKKPVAKATAPKPKKSAVKKTAAPASKSTPKKAQNPAAKKASPGKALPKKAKKPAATKKPAASKKPKTSKSPMSSKSPKAAAKKGPARASKPKAAKKAAPKK